MAAMTFSPAADLHGRQEILRTEGHTLDIILHREPGAAPDEDAPNFLATTALIDTGASDVCIDYRFAHALKLREIDQINVSVVGGSVLASRYLADLEIPALGYRQIVSVVASRVARINYNALIGRSVLCNYIVTFDGPNGCFSFHPGGFHHLQAPPDDE